MLGTQLLLFKEKMRPFARQEGDGPLSELQAQLFIFHREPGGIFPQRAEAAEHPESADALR